MTDTPLQASKAFFKSRTVISLAVSLLAMLLGRYGISMDDAENEELKDLIAEVVEIGGLISAFYFRVTARHKLVIAAFAIFLGFACLATPTALAGEDVGKEPAGKTVLLKIPEIEQPSLLDAAKISLYGHYDLDDEVFGAGFRLSYDIHENAMLRADYIAPEFDFEGSGVGASSSLTVQFSLPMENVPFAPYVITGAGITSFDEPDLSALIGAGVDWIVNERISVFLEYEYSTGDGDSINAVRLGASYSF